jgi:hypothetical protein
VKELEAIWLCSEDEAGGFPLSIRGISCRVAGRLNAE